MDDAAARTTVVRVEELLDRAEALPDPAARELVLELAQALVEMYGEGLARTLRGLANGNGGDPLARLADDELVSHLLILHDLHPEPLDARVRGALAEVRPYLESHGGDVELLAIEGGTVRLRLEGSCSGCPSSALTLKSSVEEAIFAAAPEVEAVEAEGVTEEVKPQLLQIEPAATLSCPAAEMAAARGVAP